VITEPSQPLIDDAMEVSVAPAADDPDGGARASMAAAAPAAASPPPPEHTSSGSPMMAEPETHAPVNDGLIEDTPESNLELDVAFGAALGERGGAVGPPTSRPRATQTKRISSAGRQGSSD